MKRCSQCHFTFDDDEQICDFDHTELTPYPEPLTSSQKVPVPRQSLQSPLLRLARSHVSLTILALAGVALSALLVGYFDSASEANVDSYSNAESREARVSPVSPNDAPLQSPTEPPEPAVKIVSPNTLTRPQSVNAIRDSSPMPRRPTIASRSRARFRTSTPVRKQTTAFAKAQQTRTFEREHLKKESRVNTIVRKTGNFLKKTVSILKKPF